MNSPERIWRTSTGTGQASACGYMTKVGHASTNSNRCSHKQVHLTEEEEEEEEGDRQGGSLTMLFSKNKALAL